jgi:preprotein translocase subunit SecY
MPYISASIIMQLLTYVLPTFEQMKKEGEGGRRKITQYTRYGTLGLGIVSVFGHCACIWKVCGARHCARIWVPHDGNGHSDRWHHVSDVAWRADYRAWAWATVSRYLIFGGIAAGLPSAIGGLLELVRTGAMSIIVALFIVASSGVLVTYFVVFVERGQRKILVNYARRQVGNKVYGGQSSHLATETEHGWGDSSDLCVVDYFDARDDCQLVQFW